MAKELSVRINLSPDAKEILPFVAALLAAVSPWSFQFARPGFEASSALFFYIAGLWLFFKAVNSRTTTTFLLAVLSIVMTLYAYNSARVVIPLTVFLLFILYRRHFPLKTWFGGLVFGLLMAWPFIRFAMSGPGLVRVSQVSIIYKKEYQGKLVQTFLTNFLKNISPYYLFYYGDPTIAHTTAYRMPLLYPVEVPFFLIGVGLTLKKRSRELTFMLGVLLIGLIPPALATLNPHALRGFLALPGTLFISSLGTVAVVSRLKQPVLKFGFAGLSLSILGVLTFRFLTTYHEKYLTAAPQDWQVDLKLMAEEVAYFEKRYQRVYFRDGIHREAVLWDLRIPPPVFISAKNKLELGKYIFSVKSQAQVPRTGTGLYVTNDEPVDGGRLLKTITLPNGSKGHRIWEL